MSYGGEGLGYSSQDRTAFFNQSTDKSDIEKESVSVLSFFPVPSDVFRMMFDDC